MFVLGYIPSKEVFLCPWKCTLNINTAFSVTFDQFNDYTYHLQGHFLMLYTEFKLFLFTFSDRIVAETDYLSLK